MHLNYNYWKLWELIENLREQGGIEYQRYIITRSDLLWLLPHPPLEKLNPQNIWIPTGQNYGGYNDRHSVCSSYNIKQYLNLFEYMLNLEVLKYLPCRKTVVHEIQLKAHLNYCGVKVRRFKNISYLTGDENTPTRISTVKETNINGKYYRYKNYNELLSALAHQNEFNTHQNWNKMIFSGSLIKDYLDLLRFYLYCTIPDSIGFLNLERIINKIKIK